MRTLKRLWAVLIMVLIIVPGNCVNAFADSINALKLSISITQKTRQKKYCHCKRACLRQQAEKRLRALSAQIVT